MTRETPTDEFDPRYWIAGTNASTSRLLHTMLRVRDPQAALRFYVDGIGMKLVDRYEIEAKRLTALFLGFDGDQTDGFLELAHFWDVGPPYSHGSGYGHVAIGAPDLLGTLAKLEAMGTEITVRPYKLFAGGPYLAHVRDPDGYTVELIQARRN